MSESGDEIEKIIERVCQVAGLKSLEADQDIYDAGMSSLHALTLLLDLEDNFAVAIPDTEFMNARTPRMLHSVIDAVRGKG